MRTQTSIENILSEAKIAYSFRIQEIEENRQRGIVDDRIPLIEADNITEAFNVATTDEKNLFCDALKRRGFVLSADQKLFTEEIYNDNYDTI